VVVVTTKNDNYGNLQGLRKLRNNSFFCEDCDHGRSPSED